MIETYIRKSFQKRFVDPLLANDFLQAVKPETVTLVALISGIAASFFIAFGYTLLALFFLLLTGYADIVDGSLARQQSVDSEKGAVLDIVSDRIVEFAVIFGLYMYAPDLRATAALIMTGSVLLCVTSFLVVGIFSANDGEKSFYYSPGIMERAEAFGFFIAMVFFPDYFIFLASLFSLLVLLTSAIRIYEFCSK